MTTKEKSMKLLREMSVGQRAALVAMLEGAAARIRAARAILVEDEGPHCADHYEPRQTLNDSLEGVEAVLGQVMRAEEGVVDAAVRKVYEDIHKRAIESAREWQPPAEVPLRGVKATKGIASGAAQLPEGVSPAPGVDLNALTGGDKVGPQGEVFPGEPGDYF